MANDGQTDGPEGTANATNNDGGNRWERFARSKRFLPTKPLAAIGTLAGFLAAVGGIITAVQAVWPHTGKSDLERVHSLSLGSDIDAVERNLGTNNRLTTYAGDSTSYRTDPEGPTKDLLVRIYRLGHIFVQVGYQKNTGTVVEWIVQACDPQVKIGFRRGLDSTLTLNQTTLAQVTSGDLPHRAKYSVWADMPNEQLEFSAPAGASNYTSEIWGTTGFCGSSWRGAGDEPLVSWNATPIEDDSQKPTDGPKEMSRKELQRFRQGKVINLYGQAGPLDDVNSFPLLPGHGPPFEITEKYSEGQG